MKKILFILGLILLPLNVFALTGSTSITCAKNTLEIGGTTTCTISGTASAGVSVVSAKLSSSGGISISEITSASIWQGDGEGGNFELYTDENKTGTFQIGSFKVTANSAGTGTITFGSVEFGDADFNANTISSSIYTITVNAPPVEATGVSLNPASLTLDAGSSAIITATVTPSNASNKTVTWTSSNTNVATVSNGTVRGAGVGTATITAKTSNGKSATVTVKVTEVPITGISLSPSTLNLDVNGTGVITATIAPSNASNKTITWTSSNTKVATVIDGKVTGVSEGTATITAKTSNGKTATVKVNVSKSTETDITPEPTVVSEPEPVEQPVIEVTEKNESSTLFTQNRLVMVLVVFAVLFIVSLLISKKIKED